MMLISFACGDGSASQPQSMQWQTIQQTGQFEVQIPPHWSVVLPPPLWAQQAAQQKDPGSSPSLPEFSATGPIPGSGQGDQEDLMMVAIFSEHQANPSLSIQNIAQKWTDRLEGANLSDFTSEQIGGLSVLTATGTAFDRVRGEEISVMLSVIGREAPDMSDAWILLCTGRSPASLAMTDTCSEIRHQFKLLQAAAAP